MWIVRYLNRISLFHRTTPGGGVDVCMKATKVKSFHTRMRQGYVKLLSDLPENRTHWFFDQEDTH